MSSRRAALESLALLGTLVQLVIGAWAFATLPNSIAVHWGTDGVGYGPKSNILLIPAVGATVYCACWFAAAARVPLVGLPITIMVTPENSATIWALERELIVVLKATFAAGFAGIEWLWIASAGGTLSPAFVPVTLGFVVATVGLVAWYSVAIRNAAKPRPE